MPFVLWLVKQLRRPNTGSSPASAAAWRTTRGGVRRLSTDEVPELAMAEAIAMGGGLRDLVEGVPEHVEVGQDEQHAGSAAGGRLAVAVAEGGAVATTPTARCHRTPSLVRNSRFAPGLFRSDTRRPSVDNIRYLRRD